MVEYANINDAVNGAMVYVVAVSVVLLLLITVLMVTFVIKYHKSRHPVAAQVESHTLLEILWTAIPAVLALSMFYFGWVGYKMMRTPPPDAMEVTARAQMWSWSFEYENGKKSTELYVPVGEPIKVNIVALDVLHSFYIPAFMVKQDAVPGFDQFVWFQPEEEGTFNIFCAEYCGTRHSFMMSKCIAVPPAEFATWVETDVSVVPPPSEDATEEERLAQMVLAGERLSVLKGCNACHSIDGSPLVGPTYKGLYGKTETVITGGEPRKITVDAAYIRTSILDPNADITEGYQPVMPSQEGLLNDDEINALVAYLKSLQ